MRRLIFTLCYVMWVAVSFGQETTTRNVFFSGGFALSANSYNNSGIGLVRQSPFSYALSGSPTLNIGQFSFPFSFTYSDQRFSYDHPFNRYGVSPTYKWIKLHLGHRAMKFSSFTLGSRQFKGVGLELTPGKFYMGVLSGKLENQYAKRDSLVLGSTPVETYTRTMKGAKIGIGKKSGFDIIALKVKDELNTSTPKEGDHTRLLPQDNIVLGLNLRLLLFKHFQITAETAASLHTNDARASIENDTTELPDIYYKVNKAIKTNISTRWGAAGKIQATLKLKPFDLGIEYQRVEPNFKSLGIYYMITDYKNYTANFSTKFFKKQLRLKLKGGFQQNNLSKVRRATNLRKVGSIQLSFANPKGFNFNFNFNNMQTDQRAGYVEIEDTLRLALSNKSTLFNIGYNWTRKSLRHGVSFNIGIAKFKDINEVYFTPIGESLNKNIGATYHLSHKPSHMSYSFGIHLFNFTSTNRITDGTGINLGIGKKFFDKKLTVRLNTSYSKRKLDNASDGFYLRARTRIIYKLTSKQQINFYFSFAKRPSISHTPLNEKRAGLTYGLNF